MSRFFWCAVFLLLLSDIVIQGSSNEIINYECSGSSCQLYKVSGGSSNTRIISRRDVSDSYEIKSKRLTLKSDACEEHSNIKDLYGNKLGLTSVEENAFQKCLKMKEVYLEGNLLKNLPVRVFQHNKELESIWLNDNKFTEVDMSLFRNNPNLKILSLHNNQLTKVSSSGLPVMKNLNHIFLYNNKLSDLDVESIVQKAPNLKRIRLEGNQFNCDRQQEIIELLTSRRISYIYLGQCTNAVTTVQRVTKPVAQSTNFPINTSSYNNGRCGTISYSTGFIHGGEEKLRDRFPWTAAMYVRRKYACTANFISRVRAVTAAHCFEEDPKPIEIILFIYTNRSVSVYEYIQHPKFERVPHYDIAILKTEEIYEREFVPVCLVTKDVSIVGLDGDVVSWGPSENNNFDQLRSAKLIVARRDRCKSVQNVVNVPEESICVFHGHNGAYLCLGDSGAGFLMQSDNHDILKREHQFFMRGIVSTGKHRSGNCTVSDYVILTDVTKYLSWITSF